MCARIFDSTGAPVSAEFRIAPSIFTVGADMLALPDGRFLVTWADRVGEADAQFGRIYTAEGTPAGNQFVLSDPVVRTIESGFFGDSDVTALPDGRFVFTWSDRAETYARIYDPTRYDGDGTNETVIGGSFADTLNGAGGDDVLRGAGGADRLNGGDGNDQLIGGLGADALDGGAGFDFANYNSAGAAVAVDLLAPSINAGAEAAGDTHTGIEGLIGSEFADGLLGTDEANSIYGAGGDDALSGRGGNDALIGGVGADALDGGTGFDFVSYIGSDAGLTVDLQNAAANVGAEAAGDTFTSIEGLIGSEFSDGLLGTDGANSIYGAAGDDYIWGRGGNDALFGNSGQDVLFGGLGADLLDGGDGFDFVSYIYSAGGVAVDLLVPSSNAGAEPAGDAYAGIEGLIGSDFADGLLGDDGANSIYGGAGDDFIWGRGGDDALLGTGGNDTLDGQGGNDTLIGDVGTGLDHDTFVFGPGFGVDRVYGFGYNPGDNHDFILFHASEFSSFAEVMASARQQGTAVVIQKAGDADMLILEGMDLAGLTVDDVGFYL
jgi:Ca2+-binding RTX toxin-like protein